MKLCFMGSGAFGLPTLKALAETHEIALVVSQPDRPAGRKMRLTPTDIAQWAEAQGLPVLKTEDVNQPEAVTRVANLDLDAAVVIAFGQKLSPELIAACGPLAINLHASLLPKYRGAAPIARAVMAGESEVGVSVIGLAQKMDAGVVYATDQLTVGPDETAGELHDRLSELGPDVVGQVLSQLQSGNLQPITQEETQATRAPKFAKAEGSVSFDATSEAVRARINGLNPWPGCTVMWQPAQGGEAEPIKIRRVQVAQDMAEGDASAQPGQLLAGWRVKTQDGAVELLILQAAGTKQMDAAAFAAGRALQPGDWLLPMPGFVS